MHNNKQIEKHEQEILNTRDIKQEADGQTIQNGSFSPVSYPSPFPNPAMFTPSQLLIATQFMAAFRLTLLANLAFFHPSLQGPLTCRRPHPPYHPTASNCHQPQR
ncbi:uncharacterized protein LOC123674696 isoform X2 [Harmonia axyridis]|uniref:uncharacterized protein LOC123674696 isoform X2 n=1 Tax=Harmonia axyridis TaxID=115357 RepID=UPI001E276DBA|nr:uncharacterized protein LOC123674696 isoform X2 [Harmonia axyridis]